ncbi:MAG: hypothetical protein H0T65_00245, partial [Deltaproteobacteria bacterium]|nr:hypothetical protein [Deltaproteobacteria bacterium]
MYAALLLVGVLAAPLVAWFFSGWADVRAQQRELRAEPTRAAEAKASGLASEMRLELSRLLAREAERPYFHYQNLFHDPRTGPSYYVSTSPLATGPQDQLVLGYFHLNGGGQLTTPTINDEAPHLSEQTRLPENRRFRDEVVRSFSAQLKSAPGELVADATVVKPTTKPNPSPGKTKKIKNATEEDVQQESKVVQLDPQSYAQNNASTRVYWDNYMGNNPGQQAQESITVPKSLPKQRTIPKQQETVVAEGGANAKPVTITISPFEWHTFPFAGQPALVAVRQVSTPDGTLAQGFV